jgi:hypothetical protein
MGAVFLDLPDRARLLRLGAGDILLRFWIWLAFLLKAKPAKANRESATDKVSPESFPAAGADFRHNLRSLYVDKHA